ncbi:hypothetical protein [Actinoplanes subglobosus]|uniref:Uncharacterized protein n=1 Tax=Actinoplanes subglobosus TaxID=1547892 RepID=A0ABV8IKH9_9ACTN
MIREFVAHTSPGKGRIFALVDGDYSLEAVTTLGSNDLNLVAALVSGLNNYLADRDEAPLTAILDQLPNAVQIAIRNFIKTRCHFEVGMYTDCGFNEVVRQEVSFGPLRAGFLVEEFTDYLAAAYMLGLGIRVTNEVDDGEVFWSVELRADEAFIPAGEEPRTWPLPPDVPVLSIWISESTHDGPTASAVRAALDASEKGHWTRIHTIAHGGVRSTRGWSATSEFVVDVLDAPIPTAKENLTT